MDGTVTMSLKEYDNLKEELQACKTELRATQKVLRELEIFECKESFLGNLSLEFKRSAVEYIEKAFVPFKGKFQRTDSKLSSAIWDFAVPISKVEEGKL